MRSGWLDGVFQASCYYTKEERCKVQALSWIFNVLKKLKGIPRSCKNNEWDPELDRHDPLSSALSLLHPPSQCHKTDLTSAMHRCSLFRADCWLLLFIGKFLCWFANFRKLICLMFAINLYIIWVSFNFSSMFPSFKLIYVQNKDGPLESWC